MPKIVLYNRNLDYSVRKSRRAKRLRIAVYYNQDVIVTAPIKTSYSIINKYLIKKTKWIGSKLDFYTSIPVSKSIKLTNRDFDKYTKMALEISQERIRYLNKKYKFKYRNIRIKDYKSRWGTCTKTGDLIFNFRITHLSPPIRDYIFVHELCHLKEDNHSRKFWNLIMKTIPNYTKLKADLNIKGLLIS